MHIVSVKFRENRFYSNENKNIIIRALQGAYKVNQEALDDMHKCGVHHFEFNSVDAATNFAKHLFNGHNLVFDVTTDFKLS